MAFSIAKISESDVTETNWTELKYNLRSINSNDNRYNMYSFLTLNIKLRSICKVNYII